MCGIVGIISKTTSDSLKQTVFEMSQSIKHRGPDGEGFVFLSQNNYCSVYTEDTPIINKESKTYLFNPSKPIQNYHSQYNVVFGHRRLSVIDLSESGHQPMCDNQADYWITFNGEIYNYIELKKELELKGHQFITKTDTEVVIEAYKEWGVKCLQKFNGMFAFALFDRIKNQVFCARDRVGVKPFYYSNSNKLFAFASEYKAFIKSKLIDFQINEKQQFDFIINGNLENEEQSLFNHIYELKPSHYIVYDLNLHEFNTVNYYTLPSKSLELISEKEIIETIEEKLVQAITIRLRSDVEVGSCLSGGLDSSIISGIINQLHPEKQVKLFTAVFPNEKFDEANYANELSSFVGGNWKTVSPTSKDFFNDIESLNYYQDIPIWSTSTYSQHRVMKLASDNNIKVVLDGQGADEIFAGYSHHFMALWKENFGLKTIHQINQAKHSVPDAYKLFCKQLIKDTFNLGVNYSNYFTKSCQKYTKSNSEKLALTLNKQLANDYYGRLKSFLKCEDRCSMAFGIESRVPYADDLELVNYLFSIPGSLKIKNGISKYLLREAAKKYIPFSIYNRKDKIGFETPVTSWLLPNKLEILRTIKSQLDFINIEYLTNHFEEIVTQKPNFILRIYSFSIWKKVFSEL